MKSNQDGNGKFNEEFHLLRKRAGMTYDELSKKIGYHRETLWRIECGVSGGKLDFWRAVQDTFNIPDVDMWRVMNGGSRNAGE